MKKMYFIIIIILVLGGIFWYAYRHTKEPLNNNMTQEYKHYENDSFGLSFDYPSDWELGATNEGDKNIKFSIAPTNATGGNKLSMTIIQFQVGLPYSVTLPACDADQQAGTLNINGKEYQRCKLDTEYRIGFQEKNSLGNELFFDISYDSTDPKNESTQTIEAIIRSIKF